MGPTEAKGAPAPAEQREFRLRDLVSRYGVVVALTAVMLAGLALRLWGIGQTDVVYGDEIPNVRIAMGFAATRSIIPVGGSQHPSGFPDVLLILYGLYAVVGLLLGTFASLQDVAFTYLVDPHVFYVIGRVVSALESAGVICLTYLLGKRLLNEEAGLIAAGVMAFAAQPVWFGHFVLQESQVMLLSAGALLAILRLLTSPTRRMFIIAGLLVGVAASTKYNAGLFILSLMAAYVIVSLRKGRAWRHMAGGADLWLGLGAALAGFLVVSPFWAVQPRDRLLGLLSFYRTVSSGEWVAKPATDVPILGLVTRLAAEEWAVGLLLLAGLVYALVRRRDTDVVILAGVLPLLLLAGAGRSITLHYILPAYPALAALGAALLVRLLPRPAWLAGAAAALLILPTASHVVASGVRGSAPDTRAVAARWIEGNVPRGEKVALAYFWAGSCNPPILINGPDVWFLAKSYVDSGFIARLPASFPKRLDAYFASRPVYRIAFLEEFASPEEMRAAGVRYAAVSSCAYGPYVDQPPPPAGASWADQYVKTRALYSALLAPAPGVRTLATLTPAQGYNGPEVRVLDLSPGAAGR